MYGQNYYGLQDNLMQMRQPYQTPPPPPQQSGFLWVSGEAGAKSYLVGAGQSVLLMDSEESKFYIKTSDQSGMPLPLRIFKYEEVTNCNVPSNGINQGEEYITRKEFMEKLKELKDESSLSANREYKSSLQYDEYD